MILKKLKSGDKSGYKELFDLYYTPLCLHSFKFCNSFEMAKDITQDIFVKFFDKKIYLKIDNTIGSYLFKAIKNNTLQANNKKSKYYFEEIENHINNLLEIKNDNLEHNEEEIKIYKEIDALPPKSKAVFKAIAIEDLKYKEVAIELGISINTVKTHYSRALKQLRKSLS